MTSRKPKVASHAGGSKRRTGRRGEIGAVATVRLWGQDVGAVAEDPGTGMVSFEYDPGFQSAGLEISPIHLPVSRLGPQTFPELARSTAFEGLPGVLADALPDAFGNAIIRRYFEQRGEPDAALSPVQRLLYIGKRAMGALEFHPAMRAAQSGATEEALALATLVTEARRVIEGDTTVAIPEIMQVGASAGGARAKALVLWDRSRNRVRSGFAAPEPGEEPWLIKFDGVTGHAGGPSLTRDFTPSPFGRMEYAYAQVARRAGVEMAETFLLRERDFAHFMTRRFDRVSTPTGLQRLHLHTLGGLEHVDYNVRQAFSYEEFFRTIRALGLGQPTVNQAFLRMVFNLAARNQDDHVKNIAFLMDRSGQWRLAPAYDVTWSVGGAWAQTHQMTVAGKDDDFTRADLLAVGAKFDVPRGGAELLDQVDEALSHWDAEATDAGLDAERITMTSRAFRRFV